MLPKRNIKSRFLRTPAIYFRALVLLAAVLLFAGAGRASQLNLPPEATQAIRLMYLGKTGEAIALARQLEAARPEHPLGYLIEADVLWWRIYCSLLERKYNTIDSWSRQRAPGPDDAVYLALADKVTRLAEAGLAKSDSAEMELYAGLGYASRARLTGLRYEKLATARAGVEGRKHLLRCIELDPDMADADLGLGLYNYYVDTLSGMAKVLRFFMGIPGGDKRVGLRQLETASTKAEIVQIEARYNMAKDLRNYDFDYARASTAVGPLISDFPENPLFLLLAGDLAAKLGHNEEAAMRFRAAAAAPMDDAKCAERVQQIVREALAGLGPSTK
jgi:hypothetical protein